MLCLIEFFEFISGKMKYIQIHMFLYVKKIEKKLYFYKIGIKNCAYYTNMYSEILLKIA